MHMRYKGNKHEKMACLGEKAAGATTSVHAEQEPVIARVSKSGSYRTEERDNAAYAGCNRYIHEAK